MNLRNGRILVFSIKGLFMKNAETNKVSIEDITLKPNIKYFIVYCIINNSPAAVAGKWANKGELFKAYISQGVHINYISELSYEEYLVVDAAITARNVGIVRETPKIIMGH